MARKKSLNTKAKEILKMAEEKGIEQNFLFVTTFKRYQTQLQILEDLEKVIEKDEALITKEYVKDRANIYTHPAIAEYNKTSTAANQTASTLIKIVTSLSGDGTGEKSDPFMNFINGEREI